MRPAQRGVLAVPLDREGPGPAPYEEVAGRVPPRSAAVERLDDGTALVTAGGDDLELLALHLSLLGGAVTVHEPPELRSAMAALGERLLAAAVRHNGGHEDEQAGGVQ